MTPEEVSILAALRNLATTMRTRNAEAWSVSMVPAVNRLRSRYRLPDILAVIKGWPDYHDWPPKPKELREALENGEHVQREGVRKPKDCAHCTCGFRRVIVTYLAGAAVPRARVPYAARCDCPAGGYLSGDIPTWRQFVDRMQGQVDVLSAEVEANTAPTLDELAQRNLSPVARSVLDRVRADTTGGPRPDLAAALLPQDDPDRWQGLEEWER